MDGWPLWPSHTPRLRLPPRKGGDDKRRIYMIIHPSAPICVSTLHSFDVKPALRNQDPNKNYQSTLGFYRFNQIVYYTAPRSTFVLCSHGVVAWLFRYKLVLDIYTRYVHAGLSGHSSASHATAMPKYLRPTRETSFFTREYLKSQNRQMGSQKCDCHYKSPGFSVASEIASPVLLESGVHFGIKCRGTNLKQSQEWGPPPQPWASR